MGWTKKMKEGLTSEQIKTVDKLYLEKCQEINKLTKRIEVQQEKLQKHLEEVRKRIRESEDMLILEDSIIDREILKWKLEQLRSEARWIREVLKGETDDRRAETNIAAKA
jgi:hypothetical protein